MIQPSPLIQDILVKRYLISSSGSRLANDFAAHDLPPSLVCRKVPLLPQIHPFDGFCGSKSMSKRMGDSVAIGSSTVCQPVTGPPFALAARGGKEPEAAAAAAAADPLCIISRRLTPSADITAPRSEPVRAARPAGAPPKAAPAAHKQPPTAKTIGDF